MSFIANLSAIFNLEFRWVWDSDPHASMFHIHALSILDRWILPMVFVLNILILNLREFLIFYICNCIVDSSCSIVRFYGILVWLDVGYKSLLKLEEYVQQKGSNCKFERITKKILFCEGGYCNTNWMEVFSYLYLLRFITIH